MRIGYARCSTDDQSTQLQLERLLASGCARVYQDEGVSGVAARRHELTRCLNSLQAGDALVVCSLDRLGRSLAQLMATIDGLRARRIAFESLTESINTDTAQGTLVFHLLGALAQFERALIADRTLAGRQAARRKGVKFGRPPALNPDQVRHARELMSGGASVLEVARVIGCSRSTAFRLFGAATRVTVRQVDQAPGENHATL